MPEYRSPRAHRLARILADMAPGAAVLRISQLDPTQSWPSPFCRAYDRLGRGIPLTRVRGLTAARWVIRAHPDVPWDQPYGLDLDSGVLRPTTELHATVEGTR
ncbi:hypothetical protein ACXNSR_34195 [Streptomyces sp. NC-S4]